MKLSLPLLFACAVVSLPIRGESQATKPEADQAFTHSVQTVRKPWTNRAFLNHPDDFQFVIVTDRTGGMRPGVFASAVGKVNELQPEFVISVGDLIQGGGSVRDEKEIRRQWAEFNALAEGFEMPFFYLPGNHDVSNEVGDRIWDDLFGVRYYSFVYKNVLFLCLNTQDGAGTTPYLGAEQIAWAKQELEDHSDVRWTLVFIHQPLWVTEEAYARGRAGQQPGSAIVKKAKSATGWPEIEDTLTGRKHTVYAGHVHHYVRYERQNTHYFTLGTTGGGSRLRGPSFGEFDHATWITMTDDGPRMMNLTLDGMLPEDVTTEADRAFSRSLRFTERYRDTYPFENKEVTLVLSNPFDSVIAGDFDWVLPATDHWTLEPRRHHLELQPGERQTLRFTVNHRGELSTYFPQPRLEAHFHSADDRLQIDLPLYLPLDLMEHIRRHPMLVGISPTSSKPQIDGHLDEPLWQGDPSLNRLLPNRASGLAPVQTDIWLRHDERFLYVGVRCQEPVMRDILAEVAEADGEVWEDDSVEIMIDTNRDKKTYFRLAVNAEGVLYDARQEEVGWSSSAEVAAVRDEDNWRVEMAIPFTAINADLANHRTWGLQFVRHRPRREQDLSLQWAPTIWYKSALPSLFGEATLE